MTVVELPQPCSAKPTEAQRPGVEIQHVAVQPRLSRPDFTILEALPDTLVFAGKTRIPKEQRAKKTRWHSVSRTEIGTVHFRRNYDNSACRFASSLLNIKADRPDDDRWLRYDLGFYRFKVAAGRSLFVGVTDDRRMHLCSLDGNVVASIQIEEYAPDYYHVRCADISPNGERLLFTSADKVYVLDGSLHALTCWHTLESRPAPNVNTEADCESP